MARSRLHRSLEKQTKRNIILSIVGIVAVAIILVIIGPSLMIQLSLLLEGSGSDESNVQAQKEFIPEPILDPIPTATNSTSLNISGTAHESLAINLYINDEIVEKTDADGEGNFSFTEISLSDTENTIKVRATKGKNKSDFSKSYTIKILNNPPSLSIDTPSENQSFSGDFNSAKVAGKTDPGVKVTVNGFWAIVDDEDQYRYSLSLKEGENVITIVAIDSAGNKTEQTRKVTYSR